MKQYKTKFTAMEFKKTKNSFDGIEFENGDFLIGAKDSDYYVYTTKGYMRVYSKRDIKEIYGYSI